MKPIDVRALAAINPGVWYAIEEVAGFFGRSADSARRWCRTGRLPCQRDPFDQRKYLVSGRDILAAAAELMLADIPAPTETEREREARGRAALDEIMVLAKGRPQATGGRKAKQAPAGLAEGSR